MALWGCQLGGDFFQCAATFYPLYRLVLLVLVVAVVVILGLRALVRAAFTSHTPR